MERKVANSCGFALDALSEEGCTLKLFEHVFDHVSVEGDLDPHPPPGH